MAQAKVSIVADASGVRRGVRDAEQSLDRLNKSGSAKMKKLAAAGAAGFAGLGVAAFAFGKDAAKAAMEAEAALAKAKTMVEASGVSWLKYGKAITAAADAQSKRTGFDDEATLKSIANITRVTKDHQKAIELNGLAMDLARAKNIDLQRASDIVGRVYSGNTGILARYGITVEKGASAQEALAKLQKQFAGQADAYGKTAAGASDRMKVSWENFQESVGQRVLPRIAALMDKIAELSDWLSANWPQIWAQVKDRAQRVWDWIGPTATKTFNIVKNAVMLVVNIIQGDWTAAWNNLKGVVSNAFKGLMSLHKLAADVGAALGKAIGRAIGNGIISLVEWGLNKALDGVNKASGWLNKILPGPLEIPKVGDVKLGRIGSGASTATAEGEAVNSAYMARGGVVPGPRGAGDVVPAMLTPGEVVLNERQQGLVGYGRVMGALARTGAKVGMGGFARGGVASAERFARAQVGEPYVWGGGHGGVRDVHGWDCSGFASNVAARIPGYRGGIGTTMSLFPKSRAARGDEPVVFGFRGMDSNNPRKQHMGIRVNGVWYSSGGKFKGVGVGDSRWDHLRVPPGLEYLKGAAAGGAAGAVVGDGSPGRKSSPKPIRPTRPDGLFTFSQWVSYHGRVGTRLPASDAGKRDAYWRYLAAHGAQAAPGDVAAGEGVSPGLTSDQQAAFDQLGRQAQIAGNAAAAGDAFIRTALGPGDIGGRGNRFAWQAAGGTVNVNVQAFHPGDSSTLRALADTISRAIGWQGGGLSPIVGSGL